MITDTHRIGIISAIQADLKHKQSQSKGYSNAQHATYLGINASIYSRLNRGEYERVLSDNEWMRVAMKLDYIFDKRTDWKVAETATYKIIQTQLDVCRTQSTTGLFCDEAGIGKTEAAKRYARKHVNVVYIDCSLCKTKIKLVRTIAREFGIDSRGKYVEMLQRVIEFLSHMDYPLVILDEAGDLDYAAFLELKALYNALEFRCGWYMLGAEGLKVKIERARNNGKVGYDEIFDRYGDAYQSMTSEVEADGGNMAVFKRFQCKQVLKANIPTMTNEQIDAMINECGNNLRRLRKEIMKLKAKRNGKSDN